MMTPRASLDRALRLASRALGAPIALLVRDDRGAVAAASLGVRDVTAPARAGFALSDLAAVEGIVLVPDLTADPRFAAGPWARVVRGARALALAPLRDERGRPLGVLAVMDVAPRAWTSADAIALDDLAAAQAEALLLRARAARLADELEEERTAAEARPGAARLDESAEHRRAEIAVAKLREERAANAMFRTLAESFPDGGGVILFDRDLRYTLVRGFVFSDVNLEAAEGKTLQEAFPPDVVAFYEPLFRSILRGDRGVAERNFGGRTYLVHRLPVRGEDGEITAGMLLAQDITPRIEAEAALRASEARYRLLFQKTSEAIYVVEAEGEPPGAIVEANELAASMFGYTVAELQTIHLAALLPPEREAGLSTRLRATGAGGWSTGQGPLRRKDGTQFMGAYSSGPLDLGGKRCLLVFVRDVSEEKRAVEALRAAKESAEAANRELTTFSYSVAHDLRAPLRGVSGFAQVLLDDYRDKLDADGVDCLNEIQSGARRMGSLIDGLLSLSRVTRSPLSRERVSLSAFAHGVAVDLAAAEAGRHVEVMIEGGLSAFADAALLRTLLQNLLGNAWKFTAHVAAARVEVGATPGDGAPTFFVRDNGAGFDMAYAGKLFGAFQRLHTVREFPGTGIGLATAQRIVHRHGGRIWAEGAVGAGATFHFTLTGEATEAEGRGPST